MIDTKFSFYDENNLLKQGNLIFSCEFNDKKYIIYDKNDEVNNEQDVMYIGEYEKIGDKVFIYDVSDDELEVMKTQVAIILRSLN